MRLRVSEDCRKIEPETKPTLEDLISSIRLLIDPGSLIQSHPENRTMQEEIQSNQSETHTRVLETHIPTQEQEILTPLARSTTVQHLEANLLRARPQRESSRQVEEEEKEKITGLQTKAKAAKAKNMSLSARGLILRRPSICNRLECPSDQR